MDIVFGLWADKGAYPDHGGSQRGALGQPVVGPAGFVDILETALGTGGPRVSEVVRIASFQAYLEKLDGEYFWSGSFAADPWASTRMLLTWRDELVGFGWSDTGNWLAPRLAQLAVASRAAGNMEPGLHDRINTLINALDRITLSPITSIRFIDPIAVLPVAISRLITSLRAKGCAIEEIGMIAKASEQCALGQLQRWMLGATPLAGECDGTITLASSSSEPLAAEVVGQWFAKNKAPVALIAQGGNSDLLDHGLALSGQPRAGRSKASAHRGSLQILLLAFKGIWAPFDAHALMELLTFPNSPVPPRVARYLASALESAPGKGSQQWNDAWADITEGELVRAEANGKDGSDHQEQLAAWKEWAEPVLADPIAGIELAQALAICDRVTKWAMRQYATGQDRLHLSVVSLAEQVRTALAALNYTKIPRLLVERIIDQALDFGEGNPHASAEESVWRSVAHPGAIWGSVPTVVWWNFAATQDAGMRPVWTTSERNELKARGCAADDLDRHARAVSAAWERAVANAQERIIFVSSGLDCDADERCHALAHRLKPAFDLLADRVRLEDALTTEFLSVGGCSLDRSSFDWKALPSQRMHWDAPAPFLVNIADVKQSATSLEALFGCQLQWALRHVARLRPGRVRSIPDANQLLGNLAHAIAHEVFQPGPPPTPDQASAATIDCLDRYIDEIAAPLRQPELAEELGQARLKLPQAMASLAQCLVENELVVDAMELQVSGEFEDILSMRGAVDLVARDKNGGAVIIDLKWTRSDRSRVNELKTGSAVQLASYGAMVAGNAPYRAGYYLLNQRQFAILRGSGLIGREVEAARTFPETFDAILSDWKAWRDPSIQNRILATGVEGAVDLAPAELQINREVKCEWCDYQTLCRVREA
jgi:ATP-dependent helicase/nuclease subunit B